MDDVRVRPVCILLWSRKGSLERTGTANFIQIIRLIQNELLILLSKCSFTESLLPARVYFKAIALPKNRRCPSLS